MPNNVTNMLTVFGSDEAKADFFHAVQNDEYGLGSLDFEKVIPMPDYIYRGDLSPAAQMVNGKNNWYDWSIEHWGSKWNSYGYDKAALASFDGNTLSFFTAWNEVLPVIDKLAEMYPELSFHYCWANEDLGYNVGEIEYAHGKRTREFIPEDGSAKAYELAADIMGINLEAMGFFFNKKTGSYEYVPAQDLDMEMGGM